MDERESNFCSIHNQPLHLCSGDCRSLSNLETVSGLDSEKTIETLLNPEQVQFLKKEWQIRELELQPDGKIIFPGAETTTDDVLLWKSKSGVIDAANFDGLLIVVYNSDIKIPDGCRDLKSIESHNGIGRAGEFNPESGICSIDISDTWDFLFDEYHAQNARRIAKHELRHGLVTAFDQTHKADSQPHIRNIDGDEMDPEIYRQLAYLDELHSIYLDILEGNIEGKKDFRRVDSKTYSVVDSGGHKDVASGTTEGKLIAEELFYLLQAFVLSKRMVEQTPLTPLEKIVNNLSMAAGALLGTERSLIAACTKTKLLWAELSTNKAFKEQILQFTKTYQPDVTNNTPEISERLLEILVK